MAIKAVYADFGFTLMGPVFGRENTKVALIDGAERAGVLQECGGKERLTQIYDEVMARMGSVKKLGEEGMDYLCEAAFGVLEQEKYEAATLCFIEEDIASLHPVRGIDCFSDFIGEGIRTGIITDARYPQFINRWLSKYGLQGSFLDIYSAAGKMDFRRNITAHEATKEDGKLLRILRKDLGELDIDAEEAVIIDDSVDNCIKAKEEGFRAVVFTGLLYSAVTAEKAAKVDLVTEDLSKIPLYVRNLNKTEDAEEVV